MDATTAGLAGTANGGLVSLAAGQSLMKAAFAQDERMVQMLAQATDTTRTSQVAVPINPDRGHDLDVTA
ncbi:hypothetical protein [Pararhodospirillum oryzae]|uniref:Motility protein n=1 Tax=Pararhodospirillum oryzae TaxID=478448 RepID=A0A512HB84_9PROT|nr:hypothetical protein [Pararhodospirillum oryzae]GEO82702.1 hypothetical protein ROR02_28330 [Pararhodospirillum oryzae]